jgi:cell division protease FtsH
MPSPSLPPGGKERRQQSQRPTALWWVLGALALLAIGQAYFLAPAGRQISYSEFKGLVRGGQVAEVQVGDTIIHGTLKKADNGATSFTTTRIEDPKLVEELDAASVKYSGEIVSRWLPEIISWLLPFVLIFAAWSFFARRLGGAEGGVMSFARSKAKIYAEDDVKTTFQDVAGVDEAAQELREIVEFLKTPRKFTNLGGKIPKGVLLVGPPGTGKTLLARAGRRRSQGALLQPQWLRIRRNVRRRRRRARP